MRKGIQASCEGKLSSKKLELKAAKNGEKWTRFVIAVDTNEGKFTWVHVTTFGKDAETLCATAVKGDIVLAKGELYLERAIDPDGHDRGSIHVAATTAKKIEPPLTGRERAHKAEAA
ncbi:MAG: single-stranded DNA-binding protein [Rhodomicrobium sp.]